MAHSLWAGVLSRFHRKVFHRRLEEFSADRLTACSS
jgi:hypothetical protein